MQEGLAFLGVDEFPPELRTVVVGRIEFDPEGDWSLIFRCPESPDAWWSVKFQDDKPSGMHTGD